MAKILLINPAQEDGHSSPHSIHRDIPPISILTLATYLQTHGHEPFIVDCHIDKDYKNTIRRIISEHKLEAIGITTIIGKFIDNAREVTKIIRDTKCLVPIIWGGPLVSVLTDACLRDENGADLLILHQGERPLLEFLEGYHPRDIKNTAYLLGDKLIINEIEGEPSIYTGPLSWSLLGDKINEKQIPYLAYIFTSRGCPYRCSFCYHQSHILTGRKCFFRTSEDILSELDYLNKNYGITVFTFGDDNFLTNKLRAIRVLDGMRSRGYYAEQLVGAVNDFNDDIVAAMTGVCQTAICSIESASPRLIEMINKPLDITKVRWLNRKLNDAGINIIHNFMFGIPTETEEDRLASVALMGEIKLANPNARGMAYFFTPLPGTPMFTDIEKQYGEFPKTLDFWSGCDLGGPEESYKYRPWLSTEEQNNISRFIKSFRDMFKSINPPYILNKILREKGLI